MSGINNDNDGVRHARNFTIRALVLFFLLRGRLLIQALPLKSS
jgi:hypothetical protein